MIPDLDIKNIKTLIPNNLKAIEGTMQIHQIISKTSCFCKRGWCFCPNRHYFFKDLGSGSNIAVCDSSLTDNFETVFKVNNIDSDARKCYDTYLYNVPTYYIALFF